jgi:hypothetical protein
MQQKSTTSGPDCVAGLSPQGSRAAIRRFNDGGFYQVNWLFFPFPGFSPQAKAQRPPAA